MFFQGRGKAYLAVRDTNGNPGAYVEICPDSFSVALATDSFSHINKCGAVDVEDFRGSKSSSGTLTFSFADVADAKFAIGVLGTVTATDASPGTVTDEAHVDAVTAGQFTFCGGLERHRTITALVVKDHSVSPATTLTASTDYTLDAVSGKITWLVDVDGPITVSYGYTDPASTSLLSSGQKEYAVMFENINKANDNDPGSFELYRVRFDPAKTLDMLSDELQVMELDGSVLADLNKNASDTEFGQFGRRVL